MTRLKLLLVCSAAAWLWGAISLVAASRDPFDPRGEMHIPIGIPNTLDSLKTFVEPEGCFSPGVASYGIYFWLRDRQAGKLYAPTMDDVACSHGLSEEGYLIPWSQWQVGPTVLRSEICQVSRPVDGGQTHVVGAQVRLTNTGSEPAEVTLVVALRPLGPAGYKVHRLATTPHGTAMYADDHLAIWSPRPADRTRILGTDTVGHYANEQELPTHQAKAVISSQGNCSGALGFDVELAPAQSEAFWFACPVHPGRRVVGHRWDGVSEWAQLDLAEPHPDGQGALQPDPSEGYWSEVKIEELFTESRNQHEQTIGRVALQLPEKGWAEAYRAILAHSMMCMNEGAPDVAVVNYNVFNRDGVYMANMFQKSGQDELAALAIEYFLQHPFNGRIYPEADNPGQILWLLGEHWKFTRGQSWLHQIYPSAKQLATMVTYYRTTPGPHWVDSLSLQFGEEVGTVKRKELQAGRCDGHHPEYTEAFDIAGLRAAALLAEARGKSEDEFSFSALADELLANYDVQFGDDLGKGYGSYCVLWPCRLYPLQESKAALQFADIGSQSPNSWRYFPLAKAHQGLLAGNRDAGWKTLEVHLQHPQMQGWYALDEGGRSGVGGWNHLRTTWKQGEESVAMPHGWAIAEFWLLLRDCLAFEEEDRLVVLAGVPPTWFRDSQGIQIQKLPTHFGKLSCSYQLTAPDRASLTLGGDAVPPGGFVLRLAGLGVSSVTADGEPITPTQSGDCLLPSRTQTVELVLANP